MRRHELRTAKGYIEALSQAMEDCHWAISGIVTPIISEDGKTCFYYIKAKTYTDDGIKMIERPSRRFFKDHIEKGNFDHNFGYQDCHFEDEYSGEVLFPLTDTEYLLISFNC